MPTEATDSPWVAYHASLARFGEAVRRATPPDAALGADDLPGMLTYYSGRRVVALDGLVNSPDYVLGVLRPGGVAEFIDARVDYVVIAFNPDRPRPVVRELEAGAGGREYVARVGFPFSKHLALSEYRFRESQIVPRAERQHYRETGQVWLVKVDRAARDAQQPGG